MKTTKQLGIWMDYSMAYKIERVADHKFVTEEVTSDFTWEEKQHSFFRNEASMHKKEHQYLMDYFDRIAHNLPTFDEIILFGAGKAKNEFFNWLMEQSKFASKVITVKDAHPMTERQRNAFVRDYFERHSVLIH
jgi:stalled ribosome rescue protein Dom34